MATKLTEKDYNEEFQYAEDTSNTLLKIIKEETETLDINREKVLDDRAYFIDYFREMHKDEREDWLQMEHNNVKNYDLTKTSIERYGKMLACPYFGKVVFKDEKTGKETASYLGLYGVSYDYKNWVIDWRAPVSNLYYECEPGKCSYKVPVGEKSGELLQKRRFSFENGKLKIAQNIAMPSDDDFLTEMLSENSSDHLKAIVSTLQADQNKIIRDSVGGVHVISGCAGSGKSSIAMHKIAYIIYNFRDKLRDSEIYVLSPNEAFAEYISNILPELGENNVHTFTQEELIESLTSGCEIQFSTRDESTERMLSDPNPNVLKSVKFKNSETFRKIVECYSKWFEQNFFKAQNAYFSTEIADDELHIRAKDLDTLFYQYFDDIPLNKRIERIVDLIVKKNHIVDEEIPLDLTSQLEDMCASLDFRDVYKRLFFDEDFKNSLPEELLEECGDLAQYWLDVPMWEDRVAVAYLMLMIYGTPDSKVFYLFCDESQDLSPILIRIIKECYLSAHFLFAGDLSQNVFANNADYALAICQAFPEKNFKKYELNVNYRSTKQISEYACKRTGRTNEISVVRTGDEPDIIKANGENVAELAGKWLASVNEMGYERVCVITTTKAEADQIKLDIELPEMLKVNPFFLPVYLAKGLEYDAVLLVNADGKMENMDKRFGTNMFYTGCTRAMHKLTIIE